MGRKIKHPGFGRRIPKKMLVSVTLRATLSSRDRTTVNSLPRFLIKPETVGIQYTAWSMVLCVFLGFCTIDTALLPCSSSASDTHVRQLLCLRSTSVQQDRAVLPCVFARVCACACALRASIACCGEEKRLRIVESRARGGGGVT